MYTEIRNTFLENYKTRGTVECKTYSMMALRLQNRIIRRIRVIRLFAYSVRTGAIGFFNYWQSA